MAYGYIGKTECQQCGHEVDVYTNRSAMAYYNCGPCGVRVQQKTQRGNDKFLKTVRRYEAPEEQEPPAPAQKPASAPPAPVAPPQNTKPAAKPRNGIFGGLSIG